MIYLIYLWECFDDMTDTIRIGVVGLGLIGRRHASVIRGSSDISIAGIVDSGSEVLFEAERYGVEFYSDLEQMLERERPDGLVLATPTPFHLEQGLQCISYGCPLLIEKPITVSSRDAKVLTDRALLSGVPLLVGHHRRYNGMVRAAKASLDDGVIGEIRAVQSTCWFYKPDRYFTVAPWRTAKGAGPISVNLVHDVDLLRHFCGDVEAVRAVSVPSRRGFENEDLATAVLRFESGVIATISVSDSIVSPWSWELTARENSAYPATSESCYLIGGSEGGMSLPDLRVWRHNSEPDWWTPISSCNLTCSMEDPLVVQMRHFANVIKGEEEPLVSGLQGMKSLEVVEAVSVSAESGREVKVGLSVEESAQNVNTL